VPTIFFIYYEAMKALPRRRCCSGFTFLELVIVIAVIGIMSALAISAFSDGASDAREIVARQQQATLQSAVNAWVSGQLMGRTTLSQVQSAYNAADTAQSRLDLVGGYLDDLSLDHFVSESDPEDASKIESSATKRLGWYFEFPDWDDGAYPKVELVRS
jgi:prepilin-type N-terminal cleavage/methylation domain-containing protein